MFISPAPEPPPDASPPSPSSRTFPAFALYHFGTTPLPPTSPMLCLPSNAVGSPTLPPPNSGTTPFSFPSKSPVTVACRLGETCRYPPSEIAPDVPTSHGRPRQGGILLQTKLAAPNALIPDLAKVVQSGTALGGHTSSARTAICVPGACAGLANVTLPGTGATPTPCSSLTS